MTWSKVHAPDEAQAIARAADLVADRFLADLRPSRICNDVEMDDSDPRTDTGIELCRRGQFDAAPRRFPISRPERRIRRPSSMTLPC